MKRIRASAILVAGLVATIAISYMMFTGFQILTNWLLLVLWLIGAAVGIAIANNALRIEHGASISNLTKLIYIPVLVITFVIFTWSSNLFPFLVALHTGSIGMLYTGYALFREGFFSAR